MLFTKSEIKKVATIKQDISLLTSDCMNCGLYKKKTKYQHTKIEVQGEGKKKILIIGDSITKADEELGTAFAGEEGERLSKYLGQHKINLHKDCWRIKAIRCSIDKPTYKHVRACYPYIEKFIKEKKPNLILLFGTHAIASLFGKDYSNREEIRWRNYCIPDQKLKCNIVPLYSIIQLIENDKDKNLKCMFERDIKSAIERLKQPFIEQKDHDQYVIMLTDFKTLKSTLKKVLKKKPLITYDYETTGLKPFKEGHKIVTISFSVNETKTFSFPYQYRDFWTKKELKIIHDLWQKILKDSKVRKIGYNCFSGDTKYVTKEGLKVFKETENTKQLVWTKNGWKKAEVKCFGEDYLSEIIVGPANRSRSNIKRKIYSTENHRWIIIRRLQRFNKPAIFKEIEVTTEQLKSRDKILCKLPKFIINKNTEAFRHGLIFADGARTIKNQNIFQIRLCGKKEKYKSCFPKYTYPPSSNGDPVVNWYKTDFDMKNIPINPSAEYIANFIEGWNAGDGTNSTAGNSRVITTFNKKAAYWLKENSSLGGWTCTGFSKHIQGPNNFCKKENRPYWMVIITKEEINWSVKSIKHKIKKEKIYCATLPEDEFTLQHGIYTKNSKYEEIWGAIFFKARHKWHFDPLMCAHILDNRHASTGLKFQAFVQFGVRPYDKDISKFLKAKGEFNTVEKVPLKDLLLYNGLDCIYTHMLYNQQIRIITKQKGLLSAYNFFMAGNKEMATLQLNGFCMNVNHYKKIKKQLKKKIQKIEERLLKGREARAFKKKYGKQLLLTSNQDLGNLFYNVLGKDPVYTKNENYKTDKPTLEKLNLPFIKKLFEKKKYEKALGTYLGQFEREICGNKIHPFFDLIIPVSYRSCIAKGSKILAMRDFEKYPDGVPIEEIKKGDMVYCFDDNLNPVLRPVLWAGKTGVKQIVRITYYRKGHGYGHLDCTPEHKIRLIDGSYVEAQDLLKKQHNKKQTAKSPNCHVLAGARRGDCLNFTNHLFNGTGIKEHRFIYSQLIGELTPEDVVHHKNLNHLDHTPTNLEKHTKASHATIHAKHTICSPKSRENNIKAVKEKWKNGGYDHTIKRGPDAYNWLGLTKKECLFMLYTHKGKIKITSDAYGYDFSTFKKYVLSHGIDVKEIAIKFDKNGKYISKKRLQKLSKLGRAKLKSILGHNHYRILDLYRLYGLDTKRRNGNQYGPFSPGNHAIVGVRKLKKLVAVYDIEVKDYHNFFANEICVHNSSSSPNWQNQPKRDEEIKKMIRAGMVPRKNSVLSEIDFSGSEVIASASCHKDQNFIAYLKDKSTDMHRDNCTDLLLLPHETLERTDYTKEQKKKVKLLRFYAKNQWTFAQFYGDWYGSCAPNFWETVVEGGLLLPDGMSCKDWLASQGIYELGEFENGRPTSGSFLEHCQKVEHSMWNQRFPEYTQWKKDIVEFYQKYGYIESLFGFKFTGYMTRNQCTNFPVQSASFHLLLYTLIETQKMIKKNKLKTKLVGQVHDSILADVPVPEIKFYHQEVHKIVKGLKDKFKWLVVAMEIESEISKTREEGGSLAEMQEVDPDDVKLWC